MPRTCSRPWPWPISTTVPREAAIQALCDYKPLPHRCEKVGEIDGVTFLNDSKATNIDALEKALLAMRSPVVLIAGGKDKGLDFSGLRPLLREKVKAVVLIGQMTEKLFAAWNSAVPCVKADHAGRCRRAGAATREAGRRRPLFARLLELRHVQGFRGPRRPIPRAGPGPRQANLISRPNTSTTTTKERKTHGQQRQ